jgi:hypothetical protein
MTRTGRAAVMITVTADTAFVGALLHLSRKHRLPAAPGNPLGSLPRSMRIAARCCLTVGLAAARSFTAGFWDV